MSNWFYEINDLQSTPSIRDGLDIKTERRYRKEGVRFIMECGKSLGLGHNTIATGAVYFHRFYMFQSFKSFPRYVTACSCLFLAGKVEETPKMCKDIISMARRMLSDREILSFGDHPREEVLTLERILLQTIKFDLEVEHPYSFLLKYAKCLKGDQMKIQKMVQMAWNFANDSFSTTICLQWEPEIIAAALIHLSCKLSKFRVSNWVGKEPTHLHWWDMFIADVSKEIFEEICHQILDVYQQPNSTNANLPQLPHSKSNPPPKPTKMSSTFKSPPVPNVTMSTIDEKLRSMSIPKSTTTDNVNHGYPLAYGTMLTDFKMPLPPPPLNQAMKSYSVHVPHANSSNAQTRPQLSPGECSPSPKRTKVSSTFKSSPVPNVTMPTIDEKLGSMSIRPIPMSITSNNANRDRPSVYGTMLTDFKMSIPPPPLPPPLLLLPSPLINQPMTSSPLRNHPPPNPYKQQYRHIPRGSYFYRR